MGVDRRTVIRGLAGAALAPAAARAKARSENAEGNARALPGGRQGEPGEASAPAVASTGGASVSNSLLTPRYVEFARGLTFEALPAATVHAAKRFVLDSLGCALAGWQTRKGQLAAGLMQASGGSAEAALIGTQTRLPAASAAFANAELMNALDYDAIPHTPPVTLPAVLAVAEKAGASGRAFLTAAVIAHELASRLSSASSQMSASILSTGKTPEVFGINNEAMLGTAAACAALLQADAAGVASAIGLAGYYCPPQVAHDWETGSPKSDVKYTPVGIVSQGAVTAALLARSGYTGNPHVLDGEAAFGVFYGYRKWTPDAAVRELGQTWRIEAVDFKPYACCRYIHSQIDCLAAVVRKHALAAADIERIHASGPPFNANPEPLNVRTQEDAQFSTPYMLALVASGVPLDAHCQSAERLADPAVRAMMKRIRWGTMPRNADPKLAHAARVEVVARGKRYVETTEGPRGSVSLGIPLTDDELARKFEANARTRLDARQTRRLADLLWSLDTVADIRSVTALLAA